jgi:hypothetical protein
MSTSHVTAYLTLLIAAIAASFIRVLAKVLKARASALARPWPLEAKRNVLSDRERELYRRLVQSLPEHLVLAQVQLLQVLNFKRGRRTFAVLNRISRLSLDFLILNADTMPVAAVELDDVTHERADRRRADANKNHALRSAGVPLIRWNVRNLPDGPTICAALRATAAAAAGTR